MTGGVKCLKRSGMNQDLTTPAGSHVYRNTECMMIYRPQRGRMFRLLIFF